MQHPVLVIVSILALTALVMWVIAHDMLHRYRRLKALRCPETGVPVGVIIDARHAALTAVLRAPGDPELRVQQCSNWPERAACNQACLRDPANQRELYTTRPRTEIAHAR
jgi:hypothetical protein